uniref:Apple domain-containing protein n=1 Tax=Romanomermis culicivorax TaxID=13658 RepID=A0A915I551_ROMCU
MSISKKINDFKPYPEVNSQPTKLSVQYTEKNITFCEVEAHHSFYVYNPLARLLIENRYDCILACSYHRLCEASNFVTEANLCFLHGSKPKRMKQSKTLDSYLVSTTFDYHCLIRSIDEPIP